MNTVAHACSPVVESQAEKEPSEFKASLVYTVRPCFKGQS